MGCGGSSIKPEDPPTPAPGSVGFKAGAETATAEPAVATIAQAPAAAALVAIAEPDAQAKVIVEGTSAEVKAAAEADATRDGEDWGQLTWPRRQELCNTASATVLQTRTAAQPPAVQALCTQLCSLEPPAATVVNDTSPPFPRLGVSLALLHLLAPLVPDGATTAEACFNTFKPLAARARSSVADCLLWLEACDPTT